MHGTYRCDKAPTCQETVVKRAWQMFLFNTDARIIAKAFSVGFLMLTLL